MTWDLSILPGTVLSAEEIEERLALARVRDVMAGKVKAGPERTQDQELELAEAALKRALEGGYGG